MLAETSEPEGDWDAVEAEAVDLRMPAWLMSALAHGLVILALPLFDLPPFAHRQPVTLEVTSLAADQTGDVAITQVVLSMILLVSWIGLMVMLTIWGRVPLRYNLRNLSVR